MEKKEPKWNPVSEKPTQKYASVVVRDADGGVHYDIRYDEDGGFEYWKDEGYIGGAWSPMEEEVVCWMYEKDLTAYLASIESLEKEQPQGHDEVKLKEARDYYDRCTTEWAKKEMLDKFPELKLDEAAEEQWAAMEYASKAALLSSSAGWRTSDVTDAFKAGAKWRERQMEMPDSTKLLSEWKEVKSILKEKDLRNDEWRLAYHSFLFGFSRGLNTKKSNE